VSDEPRLCACGAVLKGRANDTCRACVRMAALSRRESVLAELGRTGLTEPSRSVTARIGASAYRDLAALMKAGVVARVGRRYFPAAWLTRGGLMRSASPAR
jgi:hypothetical protein